MWSIRARLSIKQNVSRQLHKQHQCILRFSTSASHAKSPSSSSSSQQKKPRIPSMILDELKDVSRLNKKPRESNRLSKKLSRDIFDASPRRHRRFNVYENDPFLTSSDAPSISPPLILDTKHTTDNRHLRVLNQISSTKHNPIIPRGPPKLDISVEDAEADWQDANDIDTKISTSDSPKPDSIPSNDDSFITSIDKLRPFTTDPSADSSIDPANSPDSTTPELNISKTEYLRLINTLMSSFSRSQLVTYVKTHCETNSVPTKQRPALSRYNKALLCQHIVQKLWQLTPSATASPFENLFISESVELNNLDLFLLLASNGLVLRNLSGAVYKIRFDPATHTLTFVGTDRQVDNAKLNMTVYANRASHETIDLKSIKQLFVEKYGDFNISEIGRNTEVFFHKIEDDKYELVALNGNQLKRMKRLLLWLLDYNLHATNEMIIANNAASHELSLTPFKDDASLQWSQASTDWYTLRQSTGAVPSESLLNDLARFAPNSLNSDEHFGGLQDLRESIEDAKKLPSHLIRLQDKEAEQQSWGLLKSLGMGLEDDLEINRDTTESTIEQPQKESGSTSIEPQAEHKHDAQLLDRLIDPATRDKMYSQLTNFEYRSKLRGVPDSNLVNPIMTVTLGQILFKNDSTTLGAAVRTDSEKNVIPEIVNPPKDLSLLANPQNYIFNTNVPLANDKALSLPLYQYPDITSSDVAHFIHEDPHNFSVQFKFVPTPFMEELTNTKNDINTDLEVQTKYPPIEIWCDLNSKSVPDIDTMQVMTAEGENNVFVSLPSQGADLKVSCHLSGNIMHESDTLSEQQQQQEEENEGVVSDVDEILKATTSRYARLDKQPGIASFLERSKLDFSGKVANSIARYMDVNIDGTIVRYHYVSVSYRRRLEFRLGEDRMVDFNVVEGGALGGRRIEINLAGDFSRGVSKEDFDDLLSDAVHFTQDL